MGQHLAAFVFQPPSPTYDKDPGLIWLRTEHEEVIPAYYIRKEGAHFTLIFSHGNAEDLGLILRYFRDMSHELCVNFFLYEYTGYGRSTGRPREAAVYADIEAAFKYVRDVIGIPWTQIVPYGRSIGTAPSVYLATRMPVRGVVLQSPMVSIYRIPFQLRFTLPWDVFCNIDKVSDVCCPLLIIHGTRDEIVPCWHGQALYEAAKSKGIHAEAYIIEGADHNNLEVQAGDSFYVRLHRFLRDLQESPIPEKLRLQAERHGL